MVEIGWLLDSPEEQDRHDPDGEVQRQPMDMFTQNAHRA